SSLLDEIVRDGARQLLAAALQAEVAAYVEQFRDEVDEAGHRLVVRNGYHAPRQVTTAAGAVPVKQPRGNDKRIDEATGERKRFSAFAARSLAEVGYVYLWVDGIHLKVRLEQDKVCLLVMIGVRAHGAKELIALDDGHRESSQS